ncbi:MAG: GNAT family N-acetyltransferase [Patulibacter sp.]
MSGVRAVPNLEAESIQATAAFYVAVLGFEVAMDQGWIVTLVDPERPSVQLSLLTHDATAPTVAAASIEVTDVDAAHAAAVALGAEIVHPLTDEPWGVRRFFLRDPDGNVVNVLTHQTAEADRGTRAAGNEGADDGHPATQAPEDDRATFAPGVAPDPNRVVKGFVPPVVLERDGIRVVPLTADHAPGLAAAAADGELWKLHVTSVPEPGDERAYVARAHAMPDRVPFAVLDASGTVIGSTSYHDILPEPRKVSIGYTWYAARHQRTGLNTTCKLLLLGHAFEQLECRTVGWWTDGENFASQRAIERLGARKDGTIRGNAVRRDGTVRDTVMFSLTADEWPAARDRLERRLAAGGHEA